MVLQNKYKAKASRRYNAAKGAGDKRDAKPGRPSRGRRPAQHVDGRPGAGSGSGSDFGSGSEDQEEDDGSDEQDTEFPQLQASQATSGPSKTSSTDQEEDPSRPTRGKYARRRMGESNAVRLERLLAEKDPYAEDEEEPEPEIDISRLVARVAALDPNAASQAGVAVDIASKRGDQETASDVERDIDHSLDWLHERERLRQRNRGIKNNESTSTANKPLSEDTDDQIDYEQIRREKEKAEALRALKARFQGRALGERERRDARVKNAPSIHIGPGPAPGRGKDGVRDTVQDESSKSRSRDVVTNSSSSAHQRKPMLATESTPPSSKDDIDSFLASLDSTESRAASANLPVPGIKQQDDSGSRTASAAGNIRAGAGAKAGDIKQLESFLDDMLS